MKKALRILSVTMVLLLAISGTAFATNGLGPDYDACPKDELNEEELASFEKIIADYQAAMESLRGEPESRDERTILKEDKRDSLLEIVPDGFEDRFGNFGEKGNRNFGGEKGSGNRAR